MDGKTNMMQATTLIGLGEVAAFLRDHGYSPIGVTEYANGIASRNFRAELTDGSILVVRCDGRRSLEMIDLDWAYCLPARNVGVSVPTAPTLRGLIGGVPTIVRPALDGAPLSNVEPGAWPRPEDIAAILQVIHNLPAYPQDRQFFFMPFWDSNHPRRSAMREAALGQIALGEFVDIAPIAVHRFLELDEVQDALTESPTGLIHGDFTPDNILTQRGIIHVIDWEKAAIGPLCADIVQFIYYSNLFSLPMARRFLDLSLGGSAVAPGAIFTWLRYFPAYIFIHDVYSAFFERKDASNATRWAQYVRGQSAPRFRKFCENEAALMKGFP